jgi:hypothetical protein
MQIDLHAIDPELLNYFKDSVSTMSESELVIRTRGLKELIQGLKQDKPNIDLLKQRVLAKMQLKNLPPPILELLRSATLSTSLIQVLSEKAIKEGLLALYERFGIKPILASMLLDEREEIRKLANAELSKPCRNLSNIKKEDSFQFKFEPFLNTLRPFFLDQPHQPPSQKNPKETSTAQSLSKEQLEKQIKSNTLFKQILRERNGFEVSEKSVKEERDKLKKENEEQSLRIKDLNSQILSSAASLKQRIADGVADALNHRIAPWLEASEKVESIIKNQNDHIARAAQLIAQQESMDKRFGTRSSIKKEIDAARELQVKLKNAQIESLRPLPGLGEAIRSLANHIESLDKLLAGSSLEPTNPILNGLLKELQALKSLDDLNLRKKNIEKTMASDSWGIELCKNVYALVEREALRIYLSHQDLSAVDKNDAPVETPQQYIEYCLRNAKPLRIMIDGHNMLPKIKPLIGSQYFTESKGPSIAGRKLLIDRVRALTDKHPLIEADIWFDGPIQEDWTETENLRVWFSGGKGLNRADNKILDTLQSYQLQNKRSICILVTDDQDLLIKGEKLGAINSSNLEMWILLN